MTSGTGWFATNDLSDNPMNTSTGDSKPVEILYIIGSGRSGSTLLCNILGTQPDFVNAGEIYNFRHCFDTVNKYDRHCSCGAVLDECLYWKKAITLAGARAGTDRLDLKFGDPSTLVVHNYAMLSVIRVITGKRVIIDSSKRFNRLQMLLASPQFRITMLHLVRDGRAFAYSEMMTAMKRNLPHKLHFFRRLLKWQNKNIGVRLTFGRMPSYHLLHYEDFVNNPNKVLSEITGWYGMSFDPAQLDRQDRTQMHEFSGNSDFISRKSMEIRMDTRYLEHLDAWKWVPGTLLAAAGLRLFGYPFRRKMPRT